MPPVRYHELKELVRHRDMIFDRDVDVQIITHTRSIDDSYFKIKHITLDNMRFSLLPHMRHLSAEMVETNLTHEEEESFFQQWNSNFN